VTFDEDNEEIEQTTRKEYGTREMFGMRYSSINICSRLPEMWGTSRKYRNWNSVIHDPADEQEAQSSHYILFSVFLDWDYMADCFLFCARRES